MKKTYSKPQIMFEAFTLSTNIAAGCGVINDTHSEGGCGYTPERWPASVVLFNSEPLCNTNPKDTEFDGLCYDNPSAGTGMNLFTS